MDANTELNAVKKGWQYVVDHHDLANEWVYEKSGHRFNADKAIQVTSDVATAAVIVGSMATGVGEVTLAGAALKEVVTNPRVIIKASEEAIAASKDFATKAWPVVKKASEGLYNSVMVTSAEQLPKLSEALMTPGYNTPKKVISVARKVIENGIPDAIESAGFEKAAEMTRTGIKVAGYGYLGIKGAEKLKDVWDDRVNKMADAELAIQKGANAIHDPELGKKTINNVERKILTTFEADGERFLNDVHAEMKHRKDVLEEKANKNHNITDAIPLKSSDAKSTADAELIAAPLAKNVADIRQETQPSFGFNSKFLDNKAAERAQTAQQTDENTRTLH